MPSAVTQFKSGQSGNPHGRPRRTIGPRECATVKRLAARGVREKDLARAIGVSNPLWSRLKEEDPALLEALDAGRQVMHDKLVGKLFERAMKGDVVPNLFLLKTTFGYREGDVPTELRPTINIVLPGATQDADAYRKAITVESEPLLLDTPEKARSG